MKEFIEIKNARIHNLKGIDVKIPKNRLTVITGVSGSGKSSLAFDTLYEEGKRRYLNFSGSQFTIEQQDNFDEITGLSPTVAVEQRIIRQTNARSTVATRTNLDAMLASLFANYGIREEGYDDGIPLEIANFQKNSPKGMCQRCRGAGSIFQMDEDAVFTDMEIPIEDLFGKNQTHYNHLTMRFYKICGIDTKRKLSSLTKEELHLLKYGDGGGFSGPTGFMGVIPWLMESYRYHTSKGRDNWITRLPYLGRRPCPKCGGTGLGEAALHTTILGKTISEIENMYISDSYQLLKQYQGGSNQLMEAIKDRLRRLCMVGLRHLSLSRKIPTLSGGELQRVFLASYIMSSMDSIIFVFDEPTIGLHETEKENLVRLLKELIQEGNTVVAVEHDEFFIRNADYVIDIGKDAGLYGGNKVFEGSLQEFLSCKESRTAPYLTRQKAFPVKMKYRPVNKEASLQIQHANTHNLKDITVTIPLGVMVGIAGVSGSGKSSLVTDTLVPKLKELLKKRCVATESEEDEEEAFSLDVTLTGAQQIRKCYIIDQKPIGRNKTSNPATYTGMMDRIRLLFSKTEEAQKQNVGISFFSRNSEGGCERCKGEGILHHYVGYGNFVDLICDDCRGTGFVEEARAIHLKGKNICEVLAMSVEEALTFFDGMDAELTSILQVLKKVGLSYLTLGQQVPTISGGESQRIKLAKELAVGQKEKDKRGALYILDEPTTGLSMYDTETLLQILNELVDCDNSVIITEHDTHVLANCDYLIELGPSGGMEGGEIIAEGTPDELRSSEASIIGRYLS